MAKGLSIVAGGAAFARSGPAGSSAPAKAGARLLRAPERETGFLPSQEHWRLPQSSGPTLCELFAAHPRDAGWAGFLLPQVERGKPLLWVQQRMAIVESGRVHPPGLAGADIVHVEAPGAREALWAMEEGLRCSGLSAVVGELWGDPASLDFTATRRLAVAAERSGVQCWLVRLGGTASLSGARMRWRVASAPSLADPFDPRAPGAPAWDGELFRARGRPPGRWILVHEADSFRLASAPGDRAVEQVERRIA